MDSFSSKPNVRCQLGRHLAETPYTASAFSVEGPGNHHRLVKSEPSDTESKRFHTAGSGGSDSSSKKGSTEHVASSANGPRFSDAPSVINPEGEGAITYSEFGLSDDGEPGSSSESFRQHAKLNKRVLTQRYQLDQMRNIRKRIAVEDWIGEQLDKLVDLIKQNKAEDASSSYAEFTVDLDELLTCGGDTDRRAFLENKLRNLGNFNEIEGFINECIEKIRPL